MFLVLKRGKRRHGFKMVVEARRAHADFVGDGFNGHRLGIMALDPLDCLRNPLGQTIMNRNLTQASALLAGQKAIQNLADGQRREHRNVVWRVQKLQQAHDGVEQRRVQRCQRQAARRCADRFHIVHVHEEKTDLARVKVQAEA